MIDKLKEFLQLRKEVKALTKAREDKLIPPENRSEFRKEKQAFSGKDELMDQKMQTKGVSDVGIEARRADQKIPPNKIIAHGYVRTKTPEMHKQAAKEQHKKIIEHIRATAPSLPKSETVSKAVDKPSGGTLNYKELRSQYKQKIKDSKMRPAPAPITVDTSNKKLFDKELSGKVNYTKKAEVIPALVSAPLMADKVTTSSPKVVDSPNILNGYGRIIKMLKSSKR